MKGCKNAKTIALDFCEIVFFSLVLIKKTETVNNFRNIQNKKFSSTTFKHKLQVNGNTN